MTKPAIVAADIHLADAFPQRTKLFLDFLDAAAGRAGALYLLGDIFDSWAGDDDGGEAAAEAKFALAKFSAAAPVFFQHGNRDFLLGEDFARAAGGKLIGDRHVLQHGGRRFLLMHGDLLGDDFAYRCYRFCIRKTAPMAAILPRALRRRAAAGLRRGSVRHRRPAAISPKRAAMMLRRYDCQTLIHGHTHRTGEEQWRDGGESFRRYCLPDWESGDGGCLRVDENGECGFLDARWRPVSD